MKLEEDKIELTRNDRGFYYSDFGSETHGRKSFRLWVNKRLVQEDEEGPFVTFPAEAQIRKSEKGTLILKPSAEYRTFRIYAASGYRGEGYIDILEPESPFCIKFLDYASPLGSTGVSTGALVVIKKTERLVYRWRRTGRLYGSEPNGLVEIEPDLTCREVTCLADGLDELEALEAELDE